MSSGQGIHSINSQMMVLLEVEQSGNTSPGSGHVSFWYGILLLLLSIHAWYNGGHMRKINEVLSPLGIFAYTFYLQQYNLC